jgi:hypothetical protein
MSVPLRVVVWLVPVNVSLELPPAWSVSAVVPVAVPSETVTVMVAVPVLPEAAVAVRVRLAPDPPKMTLDAGTSVLLLEVALSFRLAACVLYHSAFSCISYHERSEAFYRKKRAEDKGHHQAVIALARRRVDVLWAMLRDRQTYSERPSQAA